MQRGFVCCVFLIVSLCSLGAWAGSEQFSARVRWVVDGDTIILDSGQTVRLVGLDAPELSREDQPGQYYAQQSRDRAFRLMEQPQVVVHPQGVDRFDRVLARVYLADGTWVGKVLVAEGAAFVYPASEKNPTPDTRLLSAQRRAMEREAGFWKTLLSLPQAGKIYIGNQRSKKFHSRECPFGQSMHADNRRRFTTLEQAFYAGYAPGRCCTPWPSRVDVHKMKGE